MSTNSTILALKKPQHIKPYFHNNILIIEVRNFIHLTFLYVFERLSYIFIWIAWHSWNCLTIKIPLLLHRHIGQFSSLQDFWSSNSQSTYIMVYHSMLTSLQIGSVAVKIRKSVSFIIHLLPFYWWLHHCINPTHLIIG